MSVPSTDLKSVSEQIKEKIQAQAAGLIPDEVYAQIVSAGVDSLTVQVKNINPITGREAMLSPLELMIFTEIKTNLTAHVKDVFTNSEDFKDGKWIPKDNKYEVPNIVKEIVAENADNYLKLLITGFMETTLMNSLNATRQFLNNNGIMTRY